MIDKKQVSETMSLLTRRQKVLVVIFLVLFLLVLIAHIFNSQTFYRLLSDWKITLITIIVIFFICMILFDIRLIKRYVIFDENEIITIGKIFRIKISEKKYLYSNIHKVLIGRFYNRLDLGKNIYSLFIDNNEQIIKFHTIKTYKECLEIIKLINDKIGKKIYDDTDTSYLSEDDFLRNYYKLNKMMEDVKTNKL